jgi:hypothetical protein
VGSQLRAELITQARIGHCQPDRLVPGWLVLETVLEQLGEVEHLRSVSPELLAQDVVFLPGLAHPWQVAEQEPAGMSRGHSLEFGARSVYQYGL